MKSFDKIRVFLFLLFVVNIYCVSYRPSDIPNPNINPSACGRPHVKRSAICDPDNVLKKEDKDVLEGYIQTIPTDKAQVGILIINKMSSLYTGFSSIELSSETFARSIHDTWGIGDKATDNGLLLFLSVQDRVIYISTGKGVSKQLSPAVIDLLIDHITPYLKLGRHDKALEHAVNEIKLIVTNKSIPKSKYHSSSSSSSSSLKYDDISDNFVLIFFIVFTCGVIAFQSCRRSQLEKLNQGKEKFDKLMKEMSDCQEKDTFISQSCPICLEDFPQDSNSTEETRAEVHNENQEEILSHTKSSSSSSSSSSNITGTAGNSATSGNDLDSKSTSSSDEKIKKSPRRPMSLQCGHVFCWECLTTHLKSSSGAICPICRAPVNPDDQSRPPSAPTQSHHRPFSSFSSSATSSASSSNSDVDCSANRYTSTSTTDGSTSTNTAWTRRAPEFTYRLNRVHALYPSILPTEIHAAMSSAISLGSYQTFQVLADRRNTEVQHMINNLTQRLAAQSSGSSGSNYSFGGGRSSGGGGRRF